MSVSSWLQRLFGRTYQPTTPPRAELTPEEEPERREQLASDPDDPLLTGSEEGDGAG
jgi:hypothetical protein